jgi:N-acetylmuramoyl-L-alanine amidase
MKTVFIDAGHGGINPAGRYTTAPDKMFRHSKGVFHDKSWFFEGVFNRAVADKVCKLLGKENIRHLKVYHDFNDTSLRARVDIANTYHRLINQGIYVSIHANASPSATAGKGKGFEIFTSIGNTASDPIATSIFNEVKKNLPQLVFRTDFKDGDPDKEANFFVLTQTKMPAVLLECGFFDNFDDASLLFQDNTQNLFAKSIVDGIKDFL